MSLSAALARRRALTDARVFILGYAERGVTVRSQQFRALNVVRGLRRVDGLEPSTSEVVVVGAGPAGLTASLACALEGFRKTTLVETFVPCKTICEANHRWLHPGLYSWPEEGWDRPIAGIPLLDWRAGAANQVAQHFTAAFADSNRRLGNPVEVLSGTSVTALEADGERWSVKTTTAGDRGADAVILATGWGRSKDLDARPDYWEQDGLTSTKEPAVHISGVGDSGLVDLFRSVWWGFDQLERIAGLFRRFPAEAITIAAEVGRIEAAAAALPYPERGACRASGYGGLVFAPEFRDSLLADLRRDAHGQLHPVAVTISDQHPSPFHADAFPLNRVLLSALLATTPPRTSYSQETTWPPTVPPLAVRHGSERPSLLDCPILSGWRLANRDEPDPSATCQWGPVPTAEEGSRQSELIEAIASRAGAAPSPLRLAVVCLEFLRAHAPEARGQCQARHRDTSEWELLLHDALSPAARSDEVISEVRMRTLRCAWRIFAEAERPSTVFARAIAQALDSLWGKQFWRMWGPGELPAAGLKEAVPLAPEAPALDVVREADQLSHLFLLPDVGGLAVRVLKARSPDLASTSPASPGERASLPALALLDNRCAVEWLASGSPVVQGLHLRCTRSERVLSISAADAVRRDLPLVLAECRPTAVRIGA